MKRRQTYQRGSKGLLYINQGVSDNLIGFINKQTELNGVLLLGLKLVAEKFGDVDVINYVPRTFDINSTESIPATIPLQQEAPPTHIASNHNDKQESNQGLRDNVAESIKEENQQNENQNDAYVKALEEKLKLMEAKMEKQAQQNAVRSLQTAALDIDAYQEEKSKTNLFEQDNGEDITIFPKNV